MFVNVPVNSIFDSYRVTRVNVYDTVLCFVSIASVGYLIDNTGYCANISERAIAANDTARHSFIILFTLSTSLV